MRKPFCCALMALLVHHNPTPLQARQGGFAATNAHIVSSGAINLISYGQFTAAHGTPWCEEKDSFEDEACRKETHLCST
ncbi:hypothetical protein [Ktedonosporobacter rubrisoli]|uniref:hypothetical protein n=1 Tax=Ktedonosporobacter rubrisoli TaxID=2509675 RepID=UPI0013EE42CE|nr:hypothetical protein [Ktedonosporobacter rubrisoli]